MTTTEDINDQFTDPIDPLVFIPDGSETNTAASAATAPIEAATSESARGVLAPLAEVRMVFEKVSDAMAILVKTEVATTNRRIDHIAIEENLDWCFGDNAFVEQLPESVLAACQTAAFFNAKLDDEDITCIDDKVRMLHTALLSAQQSILTYMGNYEDGEE